MAIPPRRCTGERQREWDQSVSDRQQGVRKNDRAQRTAGALASSRPVRRHLAGGLTSNLYFIAETAGWKPADRPAGMPALPTSLITITRSIPPVAIRINDRPQKALAPG